MHSSPCFSSLPSGSGGDPVSPSVGAVPAGLGETIAAADPSLTTGFEVVPAGLGQTPAAFDNVVGKRVVDDIVSQTLPSPSLSSTSLPAKCLSQVASQPDLVEAGVNSQRSDNKTWRLSLGGHSLTDSVRPFCLEVFAGSAGLTAALRGVGFRRVGGGLRQIQTFAFNVCALEH